MRTVWGKSTHVFRVHLHIKKGGNAMHVWGRGWGFIDVYDVPIKYADQSWEFRPFGDLVLFRCFCYSNVCYSDHHCTVTIWIADYSLGYSIVKNCVELSNGI